MFAAKKNFSPTHRERRKPRFQILRLAAGCVALLAASGCNIPGREYAVSPAVRGRIEPPQAGATLEYSVLSSNASLSIRVQTEVAEDGSFAFERLTLKLAGREYDRRYRGFLNLHGANGDRRNLWRGEWLRGDIAEPVELSCDLSRSTEHGQPCVVEDPTKHPWFVELGRVEYLASCASCHGVDALGDGPAAAVLSPPPADLSLIAARRFGVFRRDKILAWIDGRDRAIGLGTSAMPAWGPRLTRELSHYVRSDEIAAARLDAIVTYLESVQREAPE